MINRLLIHLAIAFDCLDLMGWNVAISDSALKCLIRREDFGGDLEW
jgi:hypothetical protein